MDAVDVESESLVVADLDEAALAAVDGRAVTDEAIGDGRVGEGDHDVVSVGDGQEHARLLEALADGRHPEGEAPLVDIELGAGGGVGAALADPLEVGVAVGLVDGATGEHVGAAHEVAS